MPSHLASNTIHGNPSRMGDGGPVRRCDILQRTHKGGRGWAATYWVFRGSARRGAGRGGRGETRGHSSENAQGREWMGRYVLGFQEIDQRQVAVVGGKGAHLGALSRIDGISGPAGACRAA